MFPHLPYSVIFLFNVTFSICASKIKLILHLLYFRMFESDYITCSINADNHDNMFRVFSEFFKSVVDVTPLTSEFFKVFSECFQNVVVANPMFQSVFRFFRV